MIFIILSSIFILSLLMTWGLRKYAIIRSVLDVPNDRSSHSVPTPRGGGMAIVAAFLLALIVSIFLNLIQLQVFLAMFGAGIVVATIGFFDDHAHIHARWRLAGHFLAAIWALYWLGGVSLLTGFGLTIELGVVGNLLAIFYLVWMLNLYNFMDGIDGIASVEAICVCTLAAFIYWLSGYEGLMLPPLFLSAAVLGFFCWNFPRALIFMGDAGSGFLGVTIGILSLAAAICEPNLLWVWLVLVGVFIVDATYTLFRRLVRHEKIYEAHRSHGYQFAARQLCSHIPVTIGVAVINIFWLGPIALAVALGALDGVIGVFIAYAPLLLLAAKFKAGAQE